MARVQMDMSGNALNRLKKMKATVDATSYAEVVKDALRLYEYVLEEEEKGHKFMIKNPDNTTQELKIFV